MLVISSPTVTRRRAVRRAAQFDCAVHSALWDGPAFYQATDVSPLGLWLRSDLALEPGERVVVSFRPPRWPAWAWPITAAGEVVRVSLPRRRGDTQPAGMGVRFTEIDAEVVAELAERLRGLPPPLPSRASAPAKAAPAAGGSLRALVRGDGTNLEFRAEAELLTAGRPPAALAPEQRVRRKRARARAEHQGRARPSRRTARRTRKTKAPRRPVLRLVG